MIYMGIRDSGKVSVALQLGDLAWYKGEGQLMELQEEAFQMALGNLNQDEAKHKEHSD